MFRMIQRRIKKLIAWAVALVVVALLGTGLWYVATVV
jgi:hypothetical protein